MGARHSLGSERNVQGACPQLPPNLSGLNGVTGLLWSLTEFTPPFFVLLPLALKGRTQDSAPNLSQTAHFECHLILLLASRPTWPGLVFSREAWHSRAGRPLCQGGVGSRLQQVVALRARQPGKSQSSAKEKVGGLSPGPSRLEHSFTRIRHSCLFTISS